MAHPAQTTASQFPLWMREARAPLDYGKFVAVADSAWSSLPPYAVNRVIDIFTAECRGWQVAAPDAAAFRIFDANGNVGCDAAMFRHAFPSADITTVEIAPETAAALRTNMGRIDQLYRGKAAAKGAARRPVKVVESDCVEYLAAGEAFNLAYFDPPWRDELALSGVPIGTVVGRTLNANAPLVALKLPPDVPGESVLEQARAVCASATMSSVHDVAKPLRAGAPARISFRIAFYRKG